MPLRPRSTTRRGSGALVGAVLAVTILTGVSACSGDDPAPGESEAAPAAGSSATGSPAPLASVVTLGKVTGRLDTKREDALLEQVSTTVDTWIDAAYGGATYPRDGFVKAFDVFTTGAARRAKADRALMSNAGLGDAVTSVELTNRRLRVDVLAVQGRPVGVTVRVAVGMEISAATERKERVTGSLFLTRESDGWRVFGYDMDRGEV